MTTTQLGSEVIKDSTMECSSVVPNCHGILSPFETKLEIMTATDMLEQKVEHESGLLVAKTYNTLSKAWLDKETCNHKSQYTAIARTVHY